MKIKVRVRAPAKVEEIPIQTEYIRLDAFLKLANLVESGGMAKNVIQDGQVRVNGEACLQRGKKLRPGDTVSFMGSQARVAAVAGPAEQEPEHAAEQA